ncbi:hypothetical protein OG21DRAFT_1499160 [Imleria badia]|nr:hypothetical protein OG21DRAFT_1499160 [Imleria badia]
MPQGIRTNNTDYPLLSSPSSLSEQLRCRTVELQSRIVRANYNTQFARTAPELAGFRDATAGRVDAMDDHILSESFRKTVHLTTYDSYAPLLAGFFEKPCKASAIVDLFAPGLPDYLCESSSTSGGQAKTFPKYNRLSKARSLDAGSSAIPGTLQRRTTACIRYLGCDQMTVENENNCTVATIYLTGGSVVGHRTRWNLDPEKDGEKMATFIFNHAAPYAAGFINKWRSFLLIHALFAVASRSLETMTMTFITAFVDMICLLDVEFDMMVDCIADGTIPALDGIAEVRHYLELNISADPERAAELRQLGRPSSRPGWCGHVWPNLHSVTAIAGGSFALSVPLVQWFLGPNTAIRALAYGSTEAYVGSPYDPLKLDQFKLTNETIIEFSDISKDDSISSLVQVWEVEVGRRYDVVVTTQDGLWRYRLGDVVEICGFDPTDGVPSFNSSSAANFMVSEKELRAATLSMVLNTEAKVVDWTTTIDDRSLPATIGFFVELANDQISDLALGPERVLDELVRSNDNVARAIAHDVFRKPTIRVVRPGTFSGFRQLKLDEGSHDLGQVKVPVVLSKVEYVTWFSTRVVEEL